MDDDYVIRNVVDVSTFLMFEATGDSEDDFYPTVGDHRDMFVSMADSDAESCSFDLSDSSKVFDLDDCCDDPQAYHVHNKYDDNDDDGPFEEEEEGHSYPAWNGEHNEYWKPIRGAKKSSASVESTKELMMTEEEKSRLFWETCLAS
ncbi:hypothetical protein I3843_08G097600 [Carya illinoinensis]|uniref:Uncharacterized protein n=1 Tax=Carya illinoinensis TaxID=32201 RepID=A0A8T1PS89_CARIL|nr:uncharacterized protein LOC122318167 [Carya illinoinensis]XP_042991286.1 uncharacterized protein LOC122318167 [Carya illinoinensis]KAG2693544.1 hypothetical protein I3760_08G101900 [Carya illinoinensis]KAG6645118.1 hypothetical protein CIPAW_08G100900 [Carya illinoinensis]KAG6700210.1 hypothetical protein I3842_08G101300 [Carya illinoinensis]KAG7967391.1 hypothetical protein I3843_08G097600 [Carya illinoinensis]KAG7967392.1 hypothetical protein I3843_08G097600 [Carya illinoinensis]